MKCDVSFEGLDGIIDAMEKAGSETAARRLRQETGRKLAERAREEMKKHIPVSRDNSRSGRKGSRPTHGHARDNIPTSVRTNRDGETYANVGWRLSDNSEYFYMKYVEWGTHGKHPQPAKHFLEATLDALDGVSGEIIEKEVMLTLKEQGFDVS